MAAKASTFGLCCSLSKVLLLDTQTYSLLTKCSKQIFSKQPYVVRAYSTKPSSIADILKLPENQPPKRDQIQSEIDSNDFFNSSFDTDNHHYFSDYGTVFHQGSIDKDDTHDFLKTTIRTEEMDPLKHSGRDLSRFYTVKPETVSTLQFPGLLRSEFIARSKAIQETGFMVREPTLECIELLTKSTSKESVAAKVVLYGRDGCGKSSVFAHTLHACFNKEWMVICPVRQYLWNYYFKEIAVSTHTAGRVDLPVESVELLMSIKKVNAHVFSKYGEEMQTQESYTWSKRELTPPGTLIERLIDFGIERPKYSSDVVGVLLKEIRLYSHMWPTSTVVALDGVNSLFGTTRIFTDRFKQATLPVSKISLVHNLVKLLASDWKNGCALLTADVRASPNVLRTTYHPKNLLQEDGFDVLNPFIPIEVPNYSDEEVGVSLDYLTERNWVQNHAYRTSKKARREILFLSSNNPLFLDNVLRSV